MNRDDPRWLEHLDIITAWGEASAANQTPPPTDEQLLAASHIRRDLNLPEHIDTERLACWPSFLSPMIGAVDVSPVADDGLILWVLSAVVVGFVTVPGSGESCRRT